MEFFKSKLLYEYEATRREGVKLNSTILDKIIGGTLKKHDLFKKGASHLGLLEGKAIVLGAESDIQFLASYIHNEILIDGKNVVQHAFEIPNIAENKLQKEILEAQKNSFSSYFEVVAVFPEKHTFVLKDLLFDDEEDIEILIKIFLNLLWLDKQCLLELFRPKNLI